MGKDTSNKMRYCANCGGEVVRKKAHPIIETIAEDLDGYLVGACIVAAVLGMTGYGIYEKREERQMELERIKAGYVVHSGDLNGDNKIDRFFIIDGKPAIVELDGKPVVDSPNIANLVNSN